MTTTLAPPSTREGVRTLELPFDHLVQPVLPLLRTNATRILGCPDLAADAVQEALIALWQLGPPTTDLRGWLVRAVRHRALHQRRTLRRRERRERLVAVPDVEHDDPSRCAACREGLEAVERAIAALPEGSRRLLENRSHGEEDYEALATRFGVPVGTIRSRLHRARAAVGLAIGA